jgi:hypothetical protein
VKVVMATYRNPKDVPVEFSIGESPGAPATVYRCAAGGTVEGPANYAEAFGRAGLVPATGSPAVGAVSSASVEVAPSPATAPVDVVQEQAHAQADLPMSAAVPIAAPAPAGKRKKGEG